MFWVVSPPDSTDWRFDVEPLITLLRRDWPGIELSHGPHRSEAVKWVFRAKGDELEGSQEDGGQAQYLDGPLDLIARYVEWWRTQVEDDQELILYDEGYNTIVPLPPGISADEILRAL